MTDKKTVVVFVDVQNDFIDGKLRNEEAIKRLPKVIEFAKSLGNGENYKVYATRDTHFESYLTDSLEGEKLPVEHCLINSDGWQALTDEDRLGIKYAVLDKFVREGIWDDLTMKDRFEKRFAATKFKLKIINIDGPVFNEFKNYVLN